MMRVLLILATLCFARPALADEVPATDTSTQTGLVFKTKMEQDLWSAAVTFRSAYHKSQAELEAERQARLEEHEETKKFVTDVAHVIGDLQTKNAALRLEVENPPFNWTAFGIGASAGGATIAAIVLAILLSPH